MNTDEVQKFIKETTSDITGFMRVPCDITVTKAEKNGRDGLLVSINTNENAGFLVGKNGQSLQALEHIIRLAVLKKLEGEVLQVSLDVNDYRKTRIAEVVDTARQAISRVRSTQKPEALEPMSSYERRVVHTELASHLDIATESIGEGLQRRVVIKPLASNF